MCQEGGVSQLYGEAGIKTLWGLAPSTFSSGCSFVSFIIDCNSKYSISLSSVGLENYQTMGQGEFVGPLNEPRWPEMWVM